MISALSTSNILAEKLGLHFTEYIEVHDSKKAHCRWPHLDNAAGVQSGTSKTATISGQEVQDLSIVKMENIPLLVSLHAGV